MIAATQSEYDLCTEDLMGLSSSFSLTEKYVKNHGENVGNLYTL